MNRSAYKFLRDGNVLFIEDLNGGMSVTNNIKNILEEISTQLVESVSKYDVVYRDTDGTIDGVKIDDAGNFIGFYFIGSHDLETAKTKIQKR